MYVQLGCVRLQKPKMFSFSKKMYIQLYDTYVSTYAYGRYESHHPFCIRSLTSSQQKGRPAISLDYCPTRATGPIIVVYP